MSPVNVHVTRYPASGTVKYSKYHPGKYLVAWHPKSSTENERTTVVIKTPKFGDILYRQIAGALARRIVNYAEEGQNVQQGEDAGFIKFGSRVDLFLPLDCAITVKLNQKVKGAKKPALPPLPSKRMKNDKLYTNFAKAVEFMNNYTEPMPADLLLKLYAYYKIANKNYKKPR